MIKQQNLTIKNEITFFIYEFIKLEERNFLKKENILKIIGIFCCSDEEPRIINVFDKTTE